MPGTPALRPALQIDPEIVPALQAHLEQALARVGADVCATGSSSPIITLADRLDRLPPTAFQPVLLVDGPLTPQHAFALSRKPPALLCA